MGSLRDREVACSASDRQGSNFESCVWRTVSSQSSHHPQEVLLAQFSLHVHKGGLKPDSFHFIFFNTSQLPFNPSSSPFNASRSPFFASPSSFNGSLPSPFNAFPLSCDASSSPFIASPQPFSAPIAPNYFSIQSFPLPFNFLWPL